MTAPGLSYPELKALNPCAKDFKRVAKLLGGAEKWDGKKISAKAARKSGATFGDIVWVATTLARIDKDVDRRVRLWIADCAAHVLHIYEAVSKADRRPRAAIIASRTFARGKVDACVIDTASAAAWVAAWADERAAAPDATWVAALVAASSAARAAAWAAASGDERHAAWDATLAAAWAAAWAAASDAASSAARAAASAAARAAASAAAWADARAAAWAAASVDERDAAWAAERSWQFDRLIEWLSAPEPEDWPLPNT